MNTPPRVVMVLVIGIIAAIFIVSSSSGIISDAGNESSQGFEAANDTATNAECVNDCRMDNPTSDMQFAECKRNRCS